MGSRSAALDRLVIPAIVLMLQGRCHGQTAGRPTELFGLWNFNSIAEPLAVSCGTCVLDYYDAKATEWYRQKTEFKKAGKFGLPLISGQDFNVMRIPPTSPQEGYRLRIPAGSGPFSEAGNVSNYTLILDILIPQSSAGKYFSIFQTDLSNRKDANFFVQNSVRGGIGFGGMYHGVFEHGAWNRVAIVVRAATGIGGVGHVNRFINGQFVGSSNTPDPDNNFPWVIKSGFYLFTDNDGETSEAYVHSIYFINRALSTEEVAALGGPSGPGLSAAGDLAAVPKIRALRRVDLLAHRGGAGNRPENTLAAIRNAFDNGADHAEIDIRLSLDGVAFLMHDEMVDRTTNGKGYACGMTIAELKKLDAGSWFDFRYKGERAPTLAEAFQAASGRGRLLLDVKSLNMGKAIRKAMKKAGAGAQDIWLEQNQSMEAIKDFRKHIKNAEVLWMVVPQDLSEASFAKLKSQGIAAFELEFGTFSKDFVDLAHANGMKVFTFTIFDEQTMQAAINLGVDGFETDFPEYFDKLMPPRERISPHPTTDKSLP